MQFRLKDCEFNTYYVNDDKDGDFIVNYTKENNKITCRINFTVRRGNNCYYRKFRGVSKLHPDDVYDEGYGKILAFRRAYEKYAKRRSKIAIEKAAALQKEAVALHKEYQDSNAGLEFFKHLEEHYLERKEKRL